MHKNICKFYERGYCIKGNNCIIDHSFSAVICKFFQDGGCKSGNKCIYRHLSVQDLIKKICRYPELDHSNKDNTLITIKQRGGFVDRNLEDKLSKFYWEATLKAVNVDMKVSTLRHPITCIDRDIYVCISKLYEESKKIDINNPESFL
jgi:hypothetical protein